MSALIIALVENVRLWGLIGFALLFVAAVARPHFQAVKASSPIAIRRFAICVLLSAALIAVANYIVNPFGVYPTHFFEPIGNISREVKLRLLEQYPAVPQYVVLGSSRSLNISPAEIQRETGQAAFNAGVYSGRPRDFYAIALYLEQQHRLPKVFIVGLGMEQVSADTDTIPKFEYVDPLDKYVPEEAPSPSLLSVEQTLATFRILAYTVGRRPPTNFLLATNSGVFLPNGMQSQKQSAQMTEQTAMDILRHDPTINGNVSERQMGYFKSFVELCKRYNITLIVYFPPYHPVLLAHYEQNTPFPQLKQAVTVRLNDLQKRYPFAFYDFTDVKSFGGDSTFMYDSIHSNDAGSQKILKIIMHDLALKNFGNAF